MSAYFHDRQDAGRRLATLVQEIAWHDDAVVLALPRGGVPVAIEVARVLHAPLDVLVVRRLGVPCHEELAMGAIAPAGVRVLNQPVIDQFQVTEEQIAQVAELEMRELQRRERAYHADLPPLILTRRTAILVDDGLAPGATMRAAALSARRMGATRIIVAVPVASWEGIDAMSDVADDTISVIEPSNFRAVAYWYDGFPQLTDDDVHACLLTNAAAQFSPNEKGTQ